MLLAIFNPPKNKFEKYWFFDLIKMVLWNWYIYIFYVLLKIYVFFYNFYQKLKIFIKKQRRYEFLKIIVFWLNGLKILRHKVPTVHSKKIITILTSPKISLKNIEFLTWLKWYSGTGIYINFVFFLKHVFLHGFYQKIEKFY